LLLCAALLLLGTAGSACRATASTTATPGAGPVTGTVVSAEGVGVTDLKSLEVRDGNGKVWSFVGNGFVGETPSHLRQHIITGVPVIVTYERQADGTLLVTRVEDGTLR
jgi:hypothetical protein